MYKPSLEKAKNFSADYKIIPVSRILYADVKTPIEVLKILKTVSRHCYLLESLEDSGNRGRYTFLGYDPKLEITCTNGVLNVNAGTSISINTTNPAAYIQQIMKENQSPRFSELPPFTGGLVGYFSYDFIKYSEPSLKLDAPDEENFKDVDFMLFDKVIVFDHLKQKIILIANAKTDALEENYAKAKMELDNMAQLIMKGTATKSTPLKITSAFRPLFDKDTYCGMVEKAKQYIHEGDIFQVVLSNRLEADVEGSLLDTYRVIPHPICSISAVMTWKLQVPPRKHW